MHIDESDVEGIFGLEKDSWDILFIEMWPINDFLKGLNLKERKNSTQDDVTFE